MMDLDRIIKLLNSDEIAGALIGAEIVRFWVEPIKDRKNMIRVCIQTDRKFKPIVNISMITSTWKEIGKNCDFKEYDLSLIKLDMRVRNSGYVV